MFIYVIFSVFKRVIRLTDRESKASVINCPTSISLSKTGFSLAHQTKKAIPQADKHIRKRAYLMKILSKEFLRQRK